MMAVSADADDDTGGAASRTAAGPQLPLLRPGEPHTPAADLSMSVFKSLSTPVVARSLPASPSLGLLPGPSPGSLLPPTANQSPLAASIRAWHARLCQVHAVFCDHSCPPACPGVRSLAVLLAASSWVPPPAGVPSACCQAVEAELLICELYWGVSLLPPGVAASDVPPLRVHNYPVTARVAAAITATLAAELAAGRISELPGGPPPPHLTAIYGKEEGPTKVRIITDFSQPTGGAVNDFTDNMHFSMQSHEDAFAHLTPGAYMAKADIASAYRTVGVHPSHQHLLNFAWRDPATGVLRYYTDHRLPFGHAKAPELFCRISAAVRAMMAAMGYAATVVFVDDFFVIAADRPLCAAALAALAGLLAELGFEESLKKRLLPAQQQIFLGLLYDTASPGAYPVTVTVPTPKLRKAEALAADLAARKTVSLRALQSAVGYFNHLSYAVWSARAFTRRLIDAVRSAHRLPLGKRSVLPVTTAMRLDLQWWQRFARSFNGQAIVLHRPRMLDGFFSTDASDIGMGGFLNGLHFSIPWVLPFAQAWASLPLSARDDRRLRTRVAEYWPRPGTPTWRDIQYRELFALLWAHLLWGEPHLANLHATAHNDNNTVVHDVNFMTSPNLHRMALLRMLFGHCAAHNIRCRVTRITSEANVLSDSASRLDVVAFRAAEAHWHATVAQTHPAWPGAAVTEMCQPRVPRNPGLYTHRAALLLWGTPVSIEPAAPAHLES